MSANEEPVSKRQKTGNDEATVRSQFEQLAGMTTIVADTGDVEQIKRFKPTDATTNPSLIFKAAGLPQYKELVRNAVKYGKENGGGNYDEAMALTIDRLSVAFGVEISKVIPGYISTEVDARLSFDTEGSVKRARRIIHMYEAEGVSRDRILIKLATTWEGIEAAKILKKDNIQCNMTLLFCFAQAAACASAGVTLISPFVGRIRDWYVKAEGRSFDNPEEDPGVLSVRRIYTYYKKHGFSTIVMGASFRSKGEILALAGCDRLTIAPKFLDALQQSTDDVPLKLDATVASQSKDERVDYDEKDFRWALNEDAMATEKLAEGVRKFTVDLRKLEELLAKVE